MQGFTFNTTPRIDFGSGALARLGAHAKGHNARHALIVTDSVLVGLGFVGQAQAALEAEGIACTVFDQVTADPPAALIDQALAAAPDADLVIGLGGGSPMDVAKIAALMLRTPQALDDIYGVGLAEGPRVPLIQIPTTAGTGSEVTPIAILTTGTAEKKGVVAPILLPDLALLDPDLTLGLPPQVTAATGIDAMVHAIEAFTSVHKKNPVSDALAKEALRLLAGNIRAVCDNGKDVAARGAMLLGSMLAGQAFANAPVAAVHALAYPLGGHFHVPHGLSNALMLTAVLRFNAPAATPLYAELAPIIDPTIPDGTGDQDRTARMIEALDSLSVDLNVPRSLSDVGVKEDDLDLLARDAMNQQRLLMNNPRPVTETDARRLYEQVL